MDANVQREGMGHVIHARCIGVAADSKTKAVSYLTFYVILTQ